jgi:hypothetical protein
VELAFREIGAAEKRTFFFSPPFPVGGGWWVKTARNYTGRFASFVLSFLASLHWEI